MEAGESETLGEIDGSRYNCWLVCGSDSTGFQITWPSFVGRESIDSRLGQVGISPSPPCEGLSHLSTVLILLMANPAYDPRPLPL